MDAKRTVTPIRRAGERSVRMVRDQAREHASERAAMRSVVAQVGWTAETLQEWARQPEHDRGERGGSTDEERGRG